MRGGARAAAVLLAALVLAGCSDSPDIEFPGKARIDVDSPELRQIKKEAGVEPCEPGAASGANELPALTLPCLGGGPDVDLTSLQGPLVLTLWGSWCGPCREEMPVLADFYRQYGDRVPLIGLDVRDPQTIGAMELVRDTGVTYPLLADPDDELAGAEPFPARLPVPALAFVAADGSVDVVPGILESVDQLVDLVDQHLGVRL
jgi:thiol-disulfide isomerase/thioredoxin